MRIHVGVRLALYLVSLLIVTSPIRAQFSELATTDDGSRLYFTSTLRLGNPTHVTSGETRLYGVDARGVRLVAERGNRRYAIIGAVDGVDRPQVSGDGALLGYTLVNVCVPSSLSSCASLAIEPTIESNGSIRKLQQGDLTLSRNGRYALVTPHSSANQMPTLYDLATGRQWRTPPVTNGAYAFEPRNLASEGSVLVHLASGFAIWRDGKEFPLYLSADATPQAISDDGETVFYTQAASDGDRLIARNLALGSDISLYSRQADSFLYGFFGSSNDGRYALYLVSSGSSDHTAYVADTHTGQSRAIRLHEGEGATAGTLSGSGNAAYLATSFGRVVKIELQEGQPQSTQEVIPETPFIDLRFVVFSSFGSSGSSFVPGSIVHLFGYDHSAALDQWRGNVFLDDHALPVVSMDDARLTLQTPWEQQPGVAQFSLTVPSRSPFVQKELTAVSEVSPEFEITELGNSFLFIDKFVKGDFSGPAVDPPKPGEIIHAYMTGLGRTVGSVPTGSPTPIGTLYPTVSQMICRFPPFTQNAETLFTGLAPGLIGVYQVTFRMPLEEIPHPVNGVDCTYGGVHVGLLELQHSGSAVDYKAWRPVSRH